MFLYHLDETRTCPFCRLQMLRDEGLSGKAEPSDYVVLCNQCGFWFGRGTKDTGFTTFAEGGRGVIGLVRKEPLDSLTIPLPELIRFLSANPTFLRRINPFRAEELVCTLLRDAFGWEVRHIGGRRDQGIDAFAVLSDGGRAIVQVKWRQDGNKAESVSLVREFAGTLLARGVPNGIIITTRDRLSKDAVDEIEAVKKHPLVEMGRIDISYKTYADLLSMLEISSRRVADEPVVPIRMKDPHYYIFDGNGIWDRDHRYIEHSSLDNQSPEWINPLELLLPKV